MVRNFINHRDNTRVIFFVTGGGGCPLSGAYSNRIMSMAKGLAVLEGMSVEIWFALLGTQNLESKEGIYDGINYRYSVNPNHIVNRFTKIFLHVAGWLTTAFELLRIQGNTNVIIIACTHGLLMNPLWLLCKLKHYPVIRELNEYPQRLIIKGESGLSMYDKFVIRHCFMPFSGFIAISGSLSSYLRNNFPDKPILTIPINVQPERFAQLVCSNQKYITYVGVLSNYKDGIDVLIKAFDAIKASNVQLKLRLVGAFPSKNDRRVIESLVDKLNLSARIEFTGEVNRYDAVQYILQAYMLVLPRPDSVQAQGGFPTKLGEYLATGIPVVATSVGDIPSFLIDGENAYLAKPGSVEDFARQMSSVINNYYTAKLIARKGRILANSVFDYRVQASKISAFLNQYKRTI